MTRTQVVALIAAILEAGDRAYPVREGLDRMHQDPDGDMPAGYYAERAVEHLIAAEAAVAPDRQTHPDQPGQEEP